MARTRVCNQRPFFAIPAHDSRKSAESHSVRNPKQTETCHPRPFATVVRTHGDHGSAKREPPLDKESRVARIKHGKQVSERMKDIGGTKKAQSRQSTRARAPLNAATQPEMSKDFQEVLQSLKAGTPVIHLSPRVCELFSRDPCEDKVFLPLLIQEAAKRTLLDAVFLANNLPLNNCKHWETLIKVCEARRSKKGILMVVQAMCQDKRLTNLRLQSTAMITAFQAFARQRLVQEAVALFEKRFQGGSESVALVDGNTFLNALSSDIDLTFLWMARLRQRGFKPNLVTYNTLLKSCMHSRDTQKAETVRQMMIQAHVKGDEYTYNSLVKVFAYAGDVQKALQVGEDMRRARFKPSAVIWGSLIVVCGQNGLTEQAFGFWGDLLASGLRPSTDCLNALMNAAAEAFQGDRAMRLFRKAQAMGLTCNTWTYNVAMKSYRAPPGITLSKSQLAEAFQLLQEMQASGVQPDAMTYTAVFVLCAQSHQGEQALQLYQGLQKNERDMLDMRACTALISALGSSGSIDPAIEIFHTMVWGPARRKPSEKTYKVMISCCLENDRLEKAIEVYKGMRTQGFKPSNKGLRALIAACAEQSMDNSNTTLPAKLVGILGLEDKYELDLHGMSETEARAFVLCGLRAVQLAYKAGVNLMTDFVIITGHGVHSDEAEGPKLRAAIQKLLTAELHILKEDDVTPVFSQSQPHISTPIPSTEAFPTNQDKLDTSLLIEDQRDFEKQERDIRNKGRIIIARHKMHAWLAEKSRKQTVVSEQPQIPHNS